MAGGFRAVTAKLRRRADSEDRFSATPMEMVLRAILVYVVIGVVYTGLHIELLDQLEHRLSGPFTVFGDYAALAATMTMWPLLLGSALVCGVAGCGLI
ncbi:addiction module protein [Mycolicibacterium sp. CR10]|uniref:addiction module protein n=1 Tax=Mycolicibacterium sp. CR10 TaxID=2562314 RepID=UPI0010C0EAD5|nr:addiction module protein [Mycolicibacterium sp. CR10]